ncbi:HNH endonuclease [Pseudomonas viridiflava]|uniref:HNH endonuclease n=1 Tax=Pseudomonas viridiflava TaxID=33069 RepID=UPI000F03AE2A|nr:HNH endonuclease [Pseudomonas viridiflava]
MFNTTRPLQVPESLLSRQRYDGEDVYIQLTEMFLNKCYLCETKEPHDIQIEHFQSQQKNPDKKFDWNNLYLACSRCNNIKSSLFDDILDCCDSKIDVFRAIKHVPPVTPWAKTVQIVCMIENEQATSSRNLLDKIYNSDHTVNKKVSSSFLRTKIFDQYNLLLDQISDYYSPTATDIEKHTAVEKMKILIKRTQPYSAFIRWCIIEDEKLCEILIDLMD